MSTTFRPYAPDQMLLLPADLREWLPEGHLAHYVSDLVDGLDLTAFYAPYEGDGRRNAPYDPRMLVKVLIYAYATGVFSSRGIARKLEEDVAFRVLAAGNFPQHRTVCEFRRRHLGDFKKLFVAVVHLARELGLARFGKLSIDGTKVRANASKRKALSYGRMQAEERRLAGEIAALVAAARDTDAEEDVRLGAQVRGDELPAELRRRADRLAAIRAAKERLEAAARAADDARGRQPGQDRNPKGGRPYKRAYGAPDAKAQSNVTDPQSGIMKTSSEGFQQCYNAQVAVEGDHQLVVATGGRRRVPPWRWRGTWWRRAGRGRRPRPATPRSIRRRAAWQRRWRGGQRMRSASGCRRLRTVGSSTCWGFGASACGDSPRRAASGTWCAWR